MLKEEMMMLVKQHNFKKKVWISLKNTWLECQDCGYRAKHKVKKHPECPVVTKDIVVTLKKDPEYDVYEHLEEKMGDIGSPDEMGYWYFNSRRINLTTKSKVFVVTKSKITGFFTIEDIIWDYSEWIINFNNWFYIDSISMSGFQGIKYFKQKYQIKEEND